MMNTRLHVFGQMIVKDRLLYRMACVFGEENMKGKQRVLLVHNYYKIPGGEETVVENEKRLLEEHGHFVCLYTRNNKEMDGFSAWRKLLLPLTSLFSLRTYCDVKKLIRENEIDIVHVHNTLTLVSPSVYYAAFACGKPVVQTVHNFRLLCPAAIFLRDGEVCEDCVAGGLGCAIRHKCYRNSRLQSLVSAGILALHRFLGTYRRLFYICLTDFNREKLLLLNQGGKRKRIDPERVFVKPNFVNSTSSQLRNEVLRKDQYLYVGRLERLKGIHILLDAWKAFPEKKLVICGNGPEEEWARSYIHVNHLTGVELLGMRPHEEVLRLMSESRALILPTMWYEGQPMVILESYAAGTPVIASDIGNTGNMVEPGVTGLRFASGNVESLRQAVARMDRESGWDTRTTYERKYTWENNYELLRQIYMRARLAVEGK